MDKETFKNKFKSVERNHKALENFFSELAGKNQILNLFEPLVELGCFNPDKNPPAKEGKNEDGSSYTTTPMWNVQPYLLAVAKRMVEKPEEKICSQLRKIADDIIAHNQFGDKELRNYRTDSIIVKVIFSLPKKYIRESDIDFIGSLLNDPLYPPIYLSMDIPDVIIPKLIEDSNQELLLRVLKIITLPHPDEERNSFSLVINDYDFKRTTEKYSQTMALKFGTNPALVVLESIEYRITELKQKFDIWSVRTIEDHEQTNKYHETCDFMLVKFAREVLSYCSCNIELKELVKDLLEKDHDCGVWRRLAFHLINFRYEELGHLLWSLKNPIEFWYCKHELYELFKKHSSEFSKKEIGVIIGWINSADFLIEEKDEVTREKYLAYRRKEWLTSLKEGAISELVKEEYEKQHKINDAIVEHPGFLVYMEMTSGRISPITVEDLLNKNTNERIDYLTSFDDSNRSYRDGDKEGVAYVLRWSVARDSSSFTTELNNYKGIDYVYLWGMIEGFRDIESIYDYNFNAVLKFVLLTIEDVKFKAALAQKEGGVNYAAWYFSSINYYLRKILDQNNKDILKEKLDLIETILLKLGSLSMNLEAVNSLKDVVNLVLNSQMGKVLENLIEHFGPLKFKATGERGVPWSKDTLLFFESLLASHKFLEASVSFGRFFHIVEALNHDWLEKEFDNIFCIESDKAWKAVMIGFLFGHWRSSGSWYDLLKQKGHYTKALDTEFEDNFAYQMLASHICEGYLREYEDISDHDSLIKYLLDKRKPTLILELTKYCSNKLVDPRSKDRLYPLLDEIYKILTEHEDEIELDLTRALLFECLEHIQEIDEQIFKWTLYSAKNIRQLDAYQMVDHLLRLVGKNPEKVAKIFFVTVKAGNYPGGSSEFYRDKVSELMDSLIKYDQQNQVRQIATEYLKQGYTFVQKIIR